MRRVMKSLGLLSISLFFYVSIVPLSVSADSGAVINPYINSIGEPTYLFSIPDPNTSAMSVSTDPVTKNETE